MVVLSNPGTYGTQKCSSWCADIRRSKDPEYKHPEIQNYEKNPKTQKSKNPTFQKNPKIQKHVARFRRCEKFWILGFLEVWVFGLLGVFVFGFGDFWAFGFLDFRSRCLTTVMDKWAKCACLRVVGGWAHIYIYMYMYIHVHMSISIYVVVSMCACVH